MKDNHGGRHVRLLNYLAEAETALGRLYDTSTLFVARGLDGGQLTISDIVANQILQAIRQVVQYGRSAARRQARPAFDDRDIQALALVRQLFSHSTRHGRPVKRSVRAMPKSRCQGG